MGFVETLGPRLKSEKGAKEVDTAILANVPVVVYYFSAAWCGPCKMLTPKLAELYKAANAESKQLEVVQKSMESSSREETLRDLFWALLNSSEFSFNR